MREVLFDSDFPSNILLVLAAKTDHVETMSLDEIRELMGLRSLPRAIRWHILGTAVSDRQTYRAAIEWAYKAVTPSYNPKKIHLFS